MKERFLLRMLYSVSLLLAFALMASCGPSAPGEKNTEIISAEQALESLQGDSAVLVDARNGSDYINGHIEGAVNISRADIVINTPFPNIIAPPAQIEEALGRTGIDNSMMIIVYDDNNSMDSARLWWTLKYYGNDNVKVVSGGLKALLGAGAAVSETAPSRQSAQYRVTADRREMLAVRDDIRQLVDAPRKDAVVVDTRSIEEYEQEGTIPGSVLVDYRENLFSDGTFKPVQQIRIRYLEEKIDYDREIYLFCKTSVRGAQTYLALYNAGFRNIKLYDGAFVEWSANPMNPIYKPEKPDYMIKSSDVS